MTSIKLYVSDWRPDCRTAKNFLRDNAINFESINVDTNDWATQKVEEINNRKPYLVLNNLTQQI